MPSYLFTFRSHVSEPKLFNTFLTIFFNSQLLKSFSEYTYNIEKDNTLDAHLHIFFTSTLRDKEKVYKQFQVKEFKQFSKYLINKATIKQYGFDVKLVGKDKDKDDRLYTIGYVNKESKHTRDNLPITHYNIEIPEILKAVEYYSEYTKIDKIQLQQEHDIKVLTPKNLHIHILDFCKRYKIDTEDPLLRFKMNREGLFTDFIKEPEFHKVQHSLDQYLNRDEPEEYYKIQSKQDLLERNIFLESYTTQLSDKIFELEEIIKQLKKGG